MKSKELEESLLRELYLEKRKTSYEIAEILKVNRTTVVRYLKKYQIAINIKQRKYELIKKVPFTKEQREMIAGTLLGDGCIAGHGRKNKSYRLIIGHSEKQKDLVFYKKAILGNFVNVVNKRASENSTIYCFNTVTHNEFKFFYNLFYDNNKKIIKDELINYLTPKSLAFWIMDDGSLHKHCLRLHTEGFTEEDNIKLQRFLLTGFNIRSKIGKFNRNDKVYCYLSINKENTIKLSKLVEPYFVDCMRYKLYTDPQRLECQSLSDNSDNGDTV